MKKVICILLSVGLLLCLAACGQTIEQPQEPESTTTIATESPVITEGTEKQEENDPIEVNALTLVNTFHPYYEWADGLDIALVRSEYSSVALSPEDAALYPELAAQLEQIATMRANAMTDELDNLISFAKEDLAANADSFQTYVSTQAVLVRRADSVVISWWNDSYSNYGQIDHFKALHGSNYDTQSGQELALNDVVNINNDLAEAVEKELTSHMWTGEFYSEQTVEDYFANTPYDGFSWTVDYTGVTFYFAPGELCDEGAMTATVSFAEHPELFNEKYMAVPATYAVALPLNHSFFVELDEDGVLEELSVSGYYDEERNHYLDYGIYTDAGTEYYCEECFISDLHPYYVKTESGHFLYLFCDDLQEGLRDTMLVIFNLNADGSITKFLESPINPEWYLDNGHIMPANPEKLVSD